MEDGPIHLDSTRGDVLGFTSDRFLHGSYPWREGSEIWISFIASSGCGNFRQLVERILSLGFSVVVATPLPPMQRIVRKCGYVQEWKQMGPDLVETWRLDPTRPAIGG